MLSLQINGPEPVRLPVRAKTEGVHREVIEPVDVTVTKSPASFVLVRALEIDPEVVVRAGRTADLPFFRLTDD